MVTDTRAASGGRRPSLEPTPSIPSPAHGRGAKGVGKLRPLNSPRPLDVETDANACPEPGASRSRRDVPTAVYLAGHRRAVESVLETWRIDDEWWREQPVSRVYWRLFLENGCAVDVYRDAVRGRRYKQAYTG